MIDTFLKQSEYLVKLWHSKTTGDNYHHLVLEVVVHDPTSPTGGLHDRTAALMISGIRGYHHLLLQSEKHKAKVVTRGIIIIPLTAGLHDPTATQRNCETQRCLSCYFEIRKTIWTSLTNQGLGNIETHQRVQYNYF